MNRLEELAGSYEGLGSWHDEAGKSAEYRIEMTTQPTADGFRVAFDHRFTDGTLVHADFRMFWIGTDLFRVEVAGAPVGNGYVFGRYCHYSLRVGDAFVEASYRADHGEMEVFGSSTRNAEGLYIAWREILRRNAS